MEKQDIKRTERQQHLDLHGNGHNAKSGCPKRIKFKPLRAHKITQRILRF